MTYRSTHDAQFSTLLEELTSLQPGESLKVEDIPPSDLESIRWKIYGELRLAGIKPYFRLITLPEGIEIRRIMEISKLKITKSVRTFCLTEGAEELLKQLIPLKERSLVEEEVRKWLKEGKISMDQGTTLLEEWEKAWR